VEEADNRRQREQGHEGNQDIDAHHHAHGDEGEGGLADQTIPLVDGSDHLLNVIPQAADDLTGREERGSGARPPQDPPEDVRAQQGLYAPLEGQMHKEPTQQQDPTAHLHTGQQHDERPHGPDCWRWACESIKDVTGQNACHQGIATVQQPQDQAGVAQEDAGTSQQLGFAGRQPAGAPIQEGIQAAWQRGAPRGQPHLVKNRLEALIGDAPIEEGEVVAHGGLEDLDILGHHADVLTQVGHACSPDVLAMKLDDTLGGIVQAAQQTGERCLPATCAPEHAQDLACLHVERHLAEHERTGRVAEGDSSEADAGSAVGDHAGRPILHGRLEAEQARHTRDAGSSLLEIPDLCCDVAQRAQQETSVG